MQSSRDNVGLVSPEKGDNGPTFGSTNSGPNGALRSAANSGGVGSAMGGSLAGVDLGPSILGAAGPAPSSGPAIPAGTGPGGTPTTALSVYHLITQLCQRPDPASNLAQKQQPGQVPATNATGIEALPGSSTQREAALLELSKKREQYEDLALVLWHSFGRLPRAKEDPTDARGRCNVFTTTGDHLCVPHAITADIDCARFQQGL